MLTTIVHDCSQVQRRQRARYLPFILAVGILITAGRGTAITPVATVSVSLNPIKASLATSQTQQFTAAVKGTTNTAVTWSVSPAVGTISSGGLYSAPATLGISRTVIVTATSVADTSKKATASVTVVPPVQVTVSPSTVSLAPSGSQQFTATVTGTTKTALTWSVNGATGGNSTVGTVSNTGLYAGPASVSSPLSVTVTATSVQAPTKSATANVTVTPPVTVTVSPGTVSLGIGQTQQFSATVAGSLNTSVAWSVSPAMGTISGSGLYSTPAALGSPQTITVTATSVADTSKNATASVTVVPAVQITMSPSTASLAASQTQQFTAAVIGTTNTAVTWSVNPAMGTISGGGLYTAPASLSSPLSVTVTATSVQDTTKSATANVTVTPPVTVTLSPATVSLGVGQTQQFSATVSGPLNTSVSWSVSPALGTISSGGLYSAPAALGSLQTVTVTATSAADTSRKATASVTVVPPVQVTASPSTASLAASQTQQFAAAVTGTTNTAVTWSLSPAVGTISSAGLYSAPATVSSATSVTVTATSGADSTKSAAAVISLAPPPLTITTSTLPSGTAGTPYSASLAVTGGTGPYTWSVQSGQLVPGLSLSASGIISGTPSTEGVYTVTMQVLDMTGQKLLKSFNLAIAAALVITSVTLPNGTAETAYSATLSATGGGAPYSWSVVSGGLPPAVTLASGGTFAGTPSTAGSYNFTVLAQDSVGARATRDLGISVDPPTVSVSVSPAAANLSAGQTQQFTATVGGTANTIVKWSLNPPVGTISSGGFYSAPAALGSPRTVTVTATSAADTSKVATATLTIASPVTVSLTPTAATMLPSQGQTFTATVGGTTSTGVTWSIAPATGTVSSSGLYTAPATISSTSTVTVTATSVADATKSASATITLIPAIQITTTSLLSGTAGTAYSAAVSATGGVTPYTWSIASGQLPPGTSLSTSTGAISGTPTTAGSYNVTMKVTDAAAYQATAVLAIVVAAATCTSCPGLGITTTSLPDGAVGSAYSATLAVTGGTSPYTWSISTGQLPPGLTVSSATGVISGTPSSTGPYSFTAMVTDSASPQNTASQALAINVTATPATDQYGGLLSLPSPNPATGNWRTEKIAGRWWFIDPLNNAFHFVAPINFGFPRNSATYAKYNTNADTYNCDVLPSYIPRLKAWNFTGIGGEDSDVYMLPIFGYPGSCWGTSDGYQPTSLRVPFVIYMQTSSKAVFVKAGDYVLDQPVHAWRHTINSRLGGNGYLTAASEGEADSFDSRFYTFFNYLLVHDDKLSRYWGAPADVKKYLLGISVDEADNTFSFTTGGDNCPSDYPTTLGFCTGKEHAHGGLQVARVSPVQTANRMALSIYPDAKVYNKAVGWRNYLKNTYGTISALNTAWGSTYSACDMEGAGDQFGSCGTQITGEAFGTGDGASASYTHALAQLTPSWYSVAVYVNGAMIAGDMGFCGWSIGSPLDCNGSGIYTDSSHAPPATSKFFGPLIDVANTSMSYSTGAATIKVTTGSVGVVSVSGNGTTVTVKTGDVNQYNMKQHGTWPGAHVTISGTTNYNMTNAVVASVVNSFTFTITSSAAGAAETRGTASFTDTFLPSGAAITVSYVKNGWGIGNGVMDEDGRHSWFGSQTDETNGKTLNQVATGLKPALEALLGLMANKYFSGIDTVFSANFGSGSSRRVLNFGIEPLMYWGSPSHAGVLAAAGAYTDVLEIQTHMASGGASGLGVTLTQARLDWIGSNAGDVPLLNLDFIVAQPDSAMRDYNYDTDWTHFNTQSARGAGYLSIHTALHSFAYTNGGSKPFVGSEFYMWLDNSNETTNYGVVTVLDNAYDGHEAATSVVSCSSPLGSLACGGEKYNSGDFITSLKAANALWLKP